MKWSSSIKASIGAVITSCLIVAGVAFNGIFSTADAAGGQPASDEHLITIHDRGLEKSLITKDDTLRDAFRDAHITLDANDIVEPGIDETLVAKSYQVNVYRARPITIIDGARHVRVMSAYQTPAQIAQQAGIVLHDEDRETLSLPTDLVNDGASLQMTIDRATPVELVLYGKKETVYTQASTIDGFLKEKDIVLGPKDDMNQAKSVKIGRGMKIEIWRNGTDTQTHEEKVAFSVRVVQDTDQPVGYKKVVTTGIPGKKLVTYKVTVKNGKVVKKKAIQTVVLKKAVQQVEIIGTKVSLPSGSHEDWMRESGIASGNYGYVNYIFSNESGWNPAARNPAGYVGLGQTSESSLSGACPSWQSDPICQIHYFNGYAVSRYGSWSGAYDFKVSHGWW